MKITTLLYYLSFLYCLFYYLFYYLIESFLLPNSFWRGRKRIFFFPRQSELGNRSFQLVMEWVIEKVIGNELGFREGSSILSKLTIFLFYLIHPLLSLLTPAQKGNKGRLVRDMTNVYHKRGVSLMLSGYTARRHCESPLPESILIETAVPLFGVGKKQSISGFDA